MGIEPEGPTDAHKYVLGLLKLSPPDESRSDRLRLSPECITRSLGYKNSDYLVRICRELQNEDLINREDPGYYEITWRGRAYLEGEIEISEE